MTQLTDTVPISATRLMDVARDITLQLGEWQHHPNLTMHISNRQMGNPGVFFSMSWDAPEATMRDFIDAFAFAMNAPVETVSRRPGSQLLVVNVRDEHLSPIRVSASVTVTLGGVR